MLQALAPPNLVRALCRGFARAAGLPCALLPAGLVWLALAAQPALADCAGQNLIDSLPADERARLDDATDAVPFARGNLWSATRGTEKIVLLGTYHLDDPRHAAVMRTAAPLIDKAATVLVEAGPEEESRLMDRIGSDPGLVFITEGPTMIDRMPPEDWAALTEAMAARGIPSFMAAKFQPWYLAMMLGIPVCDATAAATAKGLDGLVIDRAAEAGIPLRALEPYDTLFSIFDSMSEGEQIEMIRSTLALEPQAEDFATTLADSYFREDGRMIWEFMRMASEDLPGYTPERVARDFAVMEEAMMIRRNRAWIPVIEEALQRGPVFAAFGALHLSGTDGVLNLLRDRGFVVERLALE